MCGPPTDCRKVSGERRPLRVAVLSLLICALPAAGMAEELLTPEAIIEFFAGGGAAAEAPTGASTRSLSGEGDGAAMRSVHVGPTGFGAGAVTAPPTEQPQAAGSPGAGALDLLITFEHDSAHLTGAARRNLDAFAEALRHPALAGRRFAIDGHTDATGPEDYNLRLSERRAAAVRDYLTAQGIEAGRLTARGFGETRPRTPDAAASQNRRVETQRLP